MMGRKEEIKKEMRGQKRLAAFERDAAQRHGKTARCAKLLSAAAVLILCAAGIAGCSMTAAPKNEPYAQQQESEQLPEKKAAEESLAEAETENDTDEAPAGQTKEERPEQEEDAQPEAQDTKDEYHVGDSVQADGLELTYAESGEFHPDNSFMQPDEGNKLIFLRFVVENVSSSGDGYISSFDFNCFADGYAAEDYYGGDNDLSATLSPGRSTEGCVYFEIPQDAQQVEVEYEVNLFTEKKIKFIYDGDLNSEITLSANTEESENAYSVGDTVEAKGMTIRYLSCEEYVSDNMFIQPEEGNHYIRLEFEFENTGSSDQSVSAFSFDCFADGKACEQSYLGDDTLSASLSAGRKVKGSVIFEVPSNAQTVEVEYLSDYWTSNRIVFKAN